MDKITVFLNTVWPIVLGVVGSYITQFIKKASGWLARYPQLSGFVITNKKALLLSVVVAAIFSVFVAGSFLVDFCIVFAVATVAYHLFVKETMSAPQ